MKIEAEPVVFVDAILQRIANGDLSVIYEINEYSAVIEERFNSGKVYNPLIVAARYGHIEIVNCLLEYQQVISSVAAYENMALSWAAKNGYTDIVNRLLDFSEVESNITANKNCALRLAAASGHIDIVNRLLKYQQVEDSITDYRNYALIVSSNNGHAHIVRRLLEYQKVRDNVAAYENQALRWAAQEGHIEVVNILLGYHEVENNITARKNAPLILAASGGYMDIVTRLLQYPEVVSDITAKNNEALRSAADNGHYEIAYILARLQFPNGIKNIPQDLSDCIQGIRKGEIIANTKEDSLKEATQLFRWLQEGYIPTSVKDLYLPPGLSSKELQETTTLPFDVMSIINDYAGNTRSINTLRPTVEELNMISIRKFQINRQIIESHSIKRIEKTREELKKSEDLYTLPCCILI